LRIVLAAASALVLAGCAGPPYSGDGPEWDATPVASDECQIVQSKDLGLIKYCRRGDYAEIFRLD
jgi:hypothetical protein